MSDSFQSHGLYSPWTSPGQNTGMGSHSLLQQISPTQESNPGLPLCTWILYPLSHQGSPRILEWVVYPFSSRSSWPRNQTGVSCIAGRFFTSWATFILPLTYCVTSEKSLYFSVYQFPVLWLRRVRDKLISTNPSQPLPWRKLRLWTSSFPRLLGSAGGSFLPLTLLYLPLLSARNNLLLLPLSCDPRYQIMKP